STNCIPVAQSAYDGRNCYNDQDGRFATNRDAYYEQSPISSSYPPPNHFAGRSMDGGPAGGNVYAVDGGHAVDRELEKEYRDRSEWLAATESRRYRSGGSNYRSEYVGDHRSGVGLGLGGVGVGG